MVKYGEIKDLGTVPITQIDIKCFKFFLIEFIILCFFYICNLLFI